MRLSPILLLPCLMLIGCKPAGDAPPSPAPPADAPRAATTPSSGTEFNRDINAVGTEPFWTVEIRATDLKLSGPDRKDLIASHTGAAVQGGAAAWTATAGDGTALKITVTTEPCSDGMSDRTYPYKAAVEAAEETLQGCAAAVDAWPEQPQTS